MVSSSNPLNVNVIQDTVIKDQFEFSDPEQSLDTLKIVSHSWYYYYCFGKFKNPTSLLNHFSLKYSITKEVRPGSDKRNVPDTVYKISKNQSYVNFVYTNCPDAEVVMNIVSGKIESADLVMTNGLKIGMEKQLALKTIFGKNNPVGIEKFDKVQIITGLTGLWFNLKFKENKLFEILITSDFVLNND